MSKTVYTKLFLTALVTSFAFGGFAALNFYIFRESIPRATTGEKILYIRSNDGPLTPQPVLVGSPTGKKGARLLPPRNIGGNRESFILKNSLFITGALFAAWLFNICILRFIERIQLKPTTRKLTRYASSYVLIGMLAVGCFYLASPEQHFPPFTGANMPANKQPLPTYRMRFEVTQLPFITAVVINTIVLAILELILVQHHKSEIELENARLKMTHLMARHQHLQHQLQPHFLFNSLSTLKSLIRTSSTAAEEYLLRLSFFLRSSLASQEQTLIPLADEVQLCCYYLDMQKIRYGDALSYVIDIPENTTATARVPALSLQLLAENALKHNAFTAEKPLKIQIACNVHGYICVCNNKQAKTTREPSSFTGLKNLSERYKMISGNAIEVNDDEHNFMVRIKML